jgi:hypothetical protein
MLQAGAPSWRESSWDDSPEIIEIREAAAHSWQASVPQATEPWEEDLAEYRQDTGAAIAAAWSAAERELQARREQQQLTAADAPKQSGSYAKPTLPQQSGQLIAARPVPQQSGQFAAARPVPQQSGQFAAARPNPTRPLRRRATAFPAPQPTAAQAQPAPRTLPAHARPPRALQPTAAARAALALPRPEALSLSEGSLDDAPLKRESIWIGPAGYAVAGVVGLLAAVFFGQALFDPGANPAAVATPPSMPAPVAVTPPPARVESDPVAAAAASSLPSQPSAASTHAVQSRSSAGTSSSRADGPVHMTWRERRAARLAAEAEARAARANATASSTSDTSSTPAEARAENAAAPSTSETRSTPAEARAENAAAPSTSDTSSTPSTAPEATRDVLADRPSDKLDDLLAPSTPAKSGDSAAAASDSDAHGTLRINSRPWSQVYVDGKLIGNTPQMSIDVKAGAHNVRLVNSEFSMSKILELDVAPGEVVSRVELLDE